MKVKIGILAVTLLVLTSGAWATTPDAGTATFNVLYDFTYGNDIGTSPSGTLILDTAGNLYGTAGNAGANWGGSVFELTPNNGTWTANVLYSFGSSGVDGIIPIGSLVRDAKGNLYGTTNSGGADGYGTVYELSPSGSGGYTETILYNFTGGQDGGGPQAGLVLKSGSLYGTANSGGAGNAGTVFELSPPKKKAHPWTFSVLHPFSTSDGSTPQAKLIFDTKGNLYGTTTWGGTGANGVVFELTPSGGTWTETVLYNFQGGSDGAQPSAPVLLTGGSLYGTTQAGGVYSGGTVFQLTPSNGSWAESILYSFTGENGGTGVNDGAKPQAGLIAKGSNFYGTTSAMCGTVPGNCV